MSTPAIEAAERSGLLVRFKPELDADESDHREIWMPPALHDWLYQSDSKRLLDYKANIRAQLKQFIVNDPQNPIDNKNYLKLLEGPFWPYIFAVRYQLKPLHRDATRIFGAFAQQDCLVLFHQKLRHELEGRQDLLDKACEKVDNKWRACLGPTPMMKGLPFSNCVSGHFDDLQ